MEGRCTHVIRILSGRYQHKYIKGMVIGHPTSFFQLKRGNEKNREVKFFSKCPHHKDSGILSAKVTVARANSS